MILDHVTDAADLIAIAGYNFADDAYGIGIGSLATRLLGPRAIRKVDRGLVVGPAKLSCVEGEFQIIVRRDLAIGELAVAIAHELAHWYYRRIASLLAYAELERACDALAFALLDRVGIPEAAAERVRELEACHVRGML